MVTVKKIRLLKIVIVVMLFLLSHSISSAQTKTGLEFIVESNPLSSGASKDNVPLNFHETSEIKLFSIGLIRLYQLFISSQDMPVCNFVPSCSRFGMEAIRKYGFLRGVLLTSDRLQRCHGLSSQYYYILDEQTGRLIDPVENYCFVKAHLIGCKKPVFLEKTGFEGDNSNVDYYNPQNILSFADYLYKEEDYLRAAGEYQRYLFYSSAESDKTIYRIALCYRLGGQTEKSIKFFEKILQEYPESVLSTSARYQIGYAYFMMGQYENSISHLKELHRVENKTYRWKLQHLMGLNYLMQKRWGDANRLFDSLAHISPDEEAKAVALKFKNYAEEGEHLPHKNPILAGSLSSILPGTGKIYCGRYADGFFSLVLLGATGLLVYDGFRHDGVDSVEGWFFGTLGGIFYLGNVYGSAVAAQIYNRQREKDLLLRVSLESNFDYFE
ncbi:membrane protein insertion efficiency factor YidD [Candidatus Poribacteria bacterium]|nr:membrane protein insertion efficiency factor YidD [Candidatus Poribacteria bacterium]